MTDEVVKRGPGRPRGTKGITASRARATLAHLVENNIETAEKWLHEVYANDGPKEALRLLLDMCEFVLPKLARQEVQNLDENGDPAGPASIRIEFVNPPKDIKEIVDERDKPTDSLSVQ